jgi:AraC-like DNA-binding protein
MSEVQVSAAGARTLVSGRFEEYDQFEAAIGNWRFAFRQLDTGPSPAGIVQLADPGTLLQRLRLTRHYDQRGETPEGMVSFGFPEESARSVRWCGRDFSDEHLFVKRPAAEFQAVSHPGFGGFTVSISEARLSDVSAALGLSEEPWLTDLDDRPVAVDPAALGSLRRKVGSIVDLLATEPAALGAAALGDELAFEIPAQLIEMLALAAGGAEVAPSSTREFALRRALQRIEDEPNEPLTVRALCEAARVSWRTLDYAFREHFGVTPKAYLKAIRLDGFRRELRDAEVGTPIADVGNRWGFWHMGQLAADYRRLYGELPSETLRRATSGGGQP